MDASGVSIDGGVNPRKDANLLSVITFFYNFKILTQGRKKDLEESDLYKILPEFEASKLGNKLEYQWQEDKNSKGKASIFLCCIKCFGLTYLVYTILQLGFGSAMIILQPKVFSKFVAYFQKGQTDLTEQDAYYYASAVVGLDLLNKFYNQNFSQLVAEYSMKIRTAVCSLIFRKALKVSPEAFSDVTVGRIVTFVSKDIYSIDGALMFIKDMVIGYLQLGVVTYLLYQRVGVPAFAAIGVIFVIILIQVIGGIKIKQNRLKSVIQSDSRYKLLQETLSSIKIIKMYTWQNYFEKLIETARVNEIAALRIVYFIKAFIIAVGGTAISLSFYTIFMLYVGKGNTIDAETIYFVQQCLSAVSGAISTSIPFGITQTADAIASVQRIQAFLESEELAQEARCNSQLPHPKISLKKVNVLIKDREILKSVSLNLEEGLFLLTGTVASGKSTLLKTILGEYQPSSGQVAVTGSFSYASQEPWLFPSTIRQNILFGQPYRKKRYEEVLKVCALTYDISKFEKHDQTKVGDNGMNLSKGQQARISLARAIYKESDMYLLDDCLASLDTHVSNYIFQECIKNFLKNTICIMVTNNLNYIKSVEATNIIYLDNGTVLSENEIVGKSIPDTEIISDEIVESPEDTVKLDNMLSGSEINLMTNTNLYHEQNKEGKVLWSTYISYYRYLGGVFACLLLIILFLAAQFCSSFGDKIISLWVNLESEINQMANRSETNGTDYNEAVKKRTKYVEIYTILMVLGLHLFIVKGLFTFHFCLAAARKLQNAAVGAMLFCYMSFFDTHFIGNIINRLSKDFYTIDEYIPFLVYDCSRSFFSSLGVIVLLATVSWGFVILIICLFFTLFMLLWFYLPTGRSLRRLEAATRSPVIGYLTSTLEGLSVVRAAQQQETLQFEFDRHQDLYTSAYYMNQTTTRLFALLIDILGTLFIFGITFKFIIFLKDNNAGDVGLAISQAISLSSVLQWVFKQIAEIETVMTSVERVLEYANAEAEPRKGREPKDWPVKGTIEFHNVSLCYRTDNREVLRNINFKINEGEKVAIVGRTGAGKSSIISILFRLYDSNGEILVDNENINNVLLKALRSAISIIPQDPVLFSGTIRTNLDPFEKYSDEEIWDALNKAHIDHLIDDLNDSVNVFSSFSVGQRQLMCLARTMVQKNKIIVLDEATASLDATISKIVDDTVQTYFKNCTVLIIAHRLESLKVCDKVLVIHDGEIVEYDKPTILLEKEGGFLNKLISEKDFHGV